jgi:hypothetical protein
MDQIRLRLQTQAGEMLSNTICDARGAIQIEISDGAIFLPDRGSQLGIPLDQPLQLVINGVKYDASDAVEID